jgi:hypothetical protein
VTTQPPLSRGSISQTLSVILATGDIIKKHGTMMKEGWSEYSQISYVHVATINNGVVVLRGCPDAQLKWWGDMSILNNLMLHTGVDDIHFHWPDAGVHTVLNEPEVNRENRLHRIAATVARAESTLGVFFNKEQFITTYVLCPT